MQALAMIVGGVILVSMAAAAMAQAIDPSEARARLGDPLALDIRVRHGNASLGSLAPHCVRAVLSMGDVRIDADDLRISVHPDAQPGWERVRLAHPMRVTEPLIDVSIELRCGAEFIRSFPVLVDLQRSAPAIRSSDRALGVKPVRQLQTVPSSAPVAHTSDVTRTSVASSVSSPPPTDTALATMTRAHAALDDEVRRLRDEQRRVQADLASLEARLSHRERGWALNEWPWRVIVVSFLLSIAWIVRNRLRWLVRRRAPDVKHAAVSGGGMFNDDLPGCEVPVVDVMSDEVQPSDERARVAAPSERRARWTNADFGEAGLGGAPAPIALREAERYVEQGIPIAAVVQMERILQAQPTKNPWCLLTLLDVYGGMAGQEGYRERVAAQLEALYNVHVPVSNSPPMEGRGLLDQPHSLEWVMAAWSGADREEKLSLLLLQPAEIELLDLAAFRDVLLLHAIARMASEGAVAAEPFNPVIDWTPTM